MRHDPTTSQQSPPHGREPSGVRRRWDRLHGSYGLETSWTSVDSRRVRSLAAGTPGELPEVVMVPGLGAPGYLAPWTRATSSWTRATLLDLPGWSRGRPRACPPTLDGVSTAIVRWLQVRDRRGVILLGHSTGAQAVMRAALEVPERVSAVVLAGPTYEPGIRSVGALVRRALVTLPREPAAELVAAGPSYLASGLLPLARMVLDTMPDRPEDLVPLLPMPVLVVTGEHDGFAPPAWCAELAGLAGARCAVIPGAHNASFPFPERADAALREAMGQWAGAVR